MGYHRRCISQKQEEIMALTAKAMLEEALVYFGKTKKNFISFKEVAQIIPVKWKKKTKQTNQA